MSDALQLAAMLEWTDPAAAAELRRLDAENAALLAANRDCLLHFNTLKADYDELVLVEANKRAAIANEVQAYSTRPGDLPAVIAQQLRSRT